MEIPEIIENISKLEEGKLLRRVDQTEKSSRQIFDESRFVKLGPSPAWRPGQ